MSTIGRLQSTEVSPKTAGICIGILAVVALVVILAVKAKVSRAPEGVTVAVATTAGASKADARKPTPAPDEKADNSRTGTGQNDDAVAVISSRNIFKPVIGQVESPPAAPVPAMGGGLPGGIPPMSFGGLPPMPGGGGFPGFGRGPGRSRGGPGEGNIAFTGVVETPEGILALLENTSTAESHFVGVGESAFGMQVLEINSRSVTLDSGGMPLSLNIGENKSDSPQTPSTPTPPIPGMQMPGAEGGTPPAGPSIMPPIPGGNAQPGRGGGRGGARRGMFGPWGNWGGMKGFGQ